MLLKRPIYLDNAASTSVDERVLAAMEPYWRVHSGNPDALHEEGVIANGALEEARIRVATALGAHADEVAFMSGGTEANNTAIFGFIKALLKERSPNSMHIVTSTIEHSSVHACFEVLSKDGVRVTYVDVDETGRVRLQDLEKALTPDTVLVSLMYVNNEIGTIADMEAIRSCIRSARKRFGHPFPYLHTDASQAIPWLSCRVEDLGADLMTLDGHKAYIPKGIGALYHRRNVPLEPIMHGGAQEQGLRPGTPPIPLVVGFGAGMALIEAERDSYTGKIAKLRDRLVAEVTRRAPRTVENGPPVSIRIAGNTNLSFSAYDAEQFVLELDARGVRVSTRSACLRDQETGSSVVFALYGDRVRSQSAVRFSLSRYTTEEDINHAIEAILETIHKLDVHAC
jgi:cysteine desulfurase